jgi:hypothetical protein
MNNLMYNKYFFNGEFFILNGMGETIYQNTSINEDIIEIDVSYIKGENNIEVESPIKQNENFINIIAKNTNKKVIYETDKYCQTENNVILVNFEKQIDKIKFIDYKKYIKNISLTNETKKLIVESIYKDCIFII